MKTAHSSNHFGLAFFLSLIMTTAVAAVVLYLGKNDSFQLINGFHSALADQFFKYVTYAGDGIMWVFVFLFSFFYRKKYIVAVIAGILISTLLTQFLKRVVFPEDLRPITFLTETFPVHVVEGVSMKRMYSFPSGHAAAAFTMALILAHMINTRSASVFFPALAMLAGYSRVYLAQHFLTDVLFGMCIGIVSALLSLLIFKSFAKAIREKGATSSEIQQEKF